MAFFSRPRSLQLLAAAILVAAFSAAPALAEKRIALVIGNSAYKHTSPLANPANDAKLMAATLRDLGFTVTAVKDATQKDMKRAVRDFGKTLNDAGRDAVGLFFYAGHGVQVRGSNYLIPVDARIDNEADVDIESVSAEGVLRQMEFAKNRLNIVMLDACRDNPYKRGFRSAARGLARMDAPTGSLIAYATAPGQVAYDGDGSNSPYTRALTRAMREPGSEIMNAFRKVRVAVMAETKKQQTPWESSSLTGEFYFTPKAARAVKQEAPPSKPKQLGSGTAGGIDNDGLFWQSIKDSRRAGDYSAYLKQFPKGDFVALARLRLAAIEERERAAKAAAAQKAQADAERKRQEALRRQQWLAEQQEREREKARAAAAATAKAKPEPAAPASQQRAKARIAAALPPARKHAAPAGAAATQPPQARPKTNVAKLAPQPAPPRLDGNWEMVIDKSNGCLSRQRVALTVDGASLRGTAENVDGNISLDTTLDDNGRFSLSRTYCPTDGCGGIEAGGASFELTVNGRFDDNTGEARISDDAGNCDMTVLLRRK
jgi:uncharacterized caspase-like protein